MTSAKANQPVRLTRSPILRVCGGAPDVVEGAGAADVVAGAGVVALLQAGKKDIAAKHRIRLILITKANNFFRSI
jgi:hypothetical protein